MALPQNSGNLSWGRFKISSLWAGTNGFLDKVAGSIRLCMLTECPPHANKIFRSWEICVRIMKEGHQQKNE